MFKTTVKAVAFAAIAAISTTAVLADPAKYDGPTFDLSTIQPEFRLGYLGDEAAQDIITRNECFAPYVEAAYSVPAKMFTFKDYAGTMESFLGGSLDYTWFGSSGYAGLYLEDPEAGVPVLTRM